MKVGSLTLKVARPKDLDEQLSTTLGCNADEMVGLLQGHCIAGTVAGALLPFIQGEKPVRHTLAEQIVKQGVESVRLKVLALYAEK